jgi:hypothetical protein
MNYEQKYIKYKKKYIDLQNSIGGGDKRAIECYNTIDKIIKLPIFNGPTYEYKKKRLEICNSFDKRKIDQTANNYTLTKISCTTGILLNYLLNIELSLYNKNKDDKTNIINILKKENEQILFNLNIQSTTNEGNFITQIIVFLTKNKIDILEIFDIQYITEKDIEILITYILIETNEDNKTTTLSLYKQNKNIKTIQTKIQEIKTSKQKIVGGARKELTEFDKKCGRSFLFFTFVCMPYFGLWITGIIFLTKCLIKLYKYTNKKNKEWTQKYKKNAKLKEFERIINLRDQYADQYNKLILILESFNFSLINLNQKNIEHICIETEINCINKDDTHFLQTILFESFDNYIKSLNEQRLGVYFEVQ